MFSYICVSRTIWDTKKPAEIVIIHRFLAFFINMVYIILAIINATIHVSLINIFKLGPDVSLSGSPTVSHTTAFL